MGKRELNFRIFYIFCLCSVTAVAAAWIVSEKFISNSWIALFVNTLLGILAALLFTRLLEARLNNSADFIIRKIRRIREGDLTQRFREDPEDLLPYGISYELGELMRFLREHIGSIWKTSVSLSRILDHFLQAIQAALTQVRPCAEIVSEFGRTLEQMKNSSTEALHLFSSIKVNGPADEKVLEQVLRLMRRNGTEFEEKKFLVNQAITEIKSLSDILKEFDAAENEFTSITETISEINGTIGQTVRQTNLISLNTSVDNIRSNGSGRNFETLSKELKKLVEEFSSFAEKSSQVTSRAEMKLKEVGLSLKKDAAAIGESLSKIEQTDRFVERLRVNGKDMVRDQALVTERISEHYREIDELESGAKASADDISASLQQYDLLATSIQATLITFDRMEEGIGELKKELSNMESFRKLFKIG